MYLFAQCRAKEDKELAALLGDFEALGLPAMVEAGLAAGSEELVLQRATESVFHKEVCGVYVYMYIRWFVFFGVVPPDPTTKTTRYAYSGHHSAVLPPHLIYTPQHHNITTPNQHR